MWSASALYLFFLKGSSNSNSSCSAILSSSNWFLCILEFFYYSYLLYPHNSLDTKTLCFYTCILDLPIFHISFGYSFLWYIQHILIHSSLVVFPQAYVRGLHIRYVTYNSISCVINYVSHLYYSWWYSSFFILRCDFADHTRII